MCIITLTPLLLAHSHHHKNVSHHDSPLTDSQSTHNRYDYTTCQISPDVAQQCDQAFRNIHAALQEAGASVKDVVRVRYLLPDRGDFQRCWPVLHRWFGDVRPAATMCQVGLMEEAMKIEVEVTAHMLE